VIEYCFARSYAPLSETRSLAVQLAQGQVALVTGGASGIGYALAKALGERGLSVALADVEPGALESAATTLGAKGVDVEPFLVDVSEAAQVEELARSVEARFGGVDVLCNNAGVMLAGLQRLWEVDPADWEWILGVNLWGVIYGLRVFVPRLIARGRGHVVNTASLAGIATVPYVAPYTAAKHAVVGLSETLAAELDEVAPGVGVTVLCPGFVATRLSEAARNRPARLGAARPPAGHEHGGVPPRRRTHVADADDVALATLAAVESTVLHVAPTAGAIEPTSARVQRLLADLSVK